MSTTDPFTRIAEAWLADGPTELPDRVLDNAFEEIHRHPRRRVLAPWRPGTMSSMFKLAAVAVVVVATLAASFLMTRTPAPGVGSPDGRATPPAASSTSPTATPAPSPDASGAAILPGTGTRLEAGLHTTDLVRPAVTMDLPCCFEVVSHTADLLVIGEAGLARYIVIANPAEVIDPATGEPAALPDDLAAWLADHPMLDVARPAQRTIGGLPFREVEGVPRRDADYNVNGELLLARGRAASGAPIFVAADHRFRLAAGDGPDGPLLVGIVTRADRFEEFLPTAEAIVEGLEFAP